MNGTETPTALSLLRKSLTRALKHLYRKLQKQQHEFRETERAEWYRQIADSLLVKVSTLPQRGFSQVALFNIHTQKEETVALNPRFDFHENAALYYKKARKGERGKEINIQKISATESEIKKLEQLIHEIDAVPAPAEEVSDLCAKIASALKLPQPCGATGAVSGIDQAEKIPYRCLTVDEWNIYIGKNDTQNDEMTTRFAKPHDLWLHVAGHAGSHVIVRRPDRRVPVPQERHQQGRIARGLVLKGKAHLLCGGALHGSPVRAQTAPRACRRGHRQPVQIDQGKPALSRGYFPVKI